MHLLSEIFPKRKERKSLAKRRETETDKGDVKPFMASSLGFGYDPSFRSSYHDSKKKVILFIQTRRRIQGNEEKVTNGKSNAPETGIKVLEKTSSDENAGTKKRKKKRSRKKKRHSYPRIIMASFQTQTWRY